MMTLKHRTVDSMINMALDQKDCGDRRSPLMTEKPMREVKSVVFYTGHYHGLLDATVKGARFFANRMLRIAKTGDV